MELIHNKRDARLFIYANEPKLEKLLMNPNKLGQYANIKKLEKELEFCNKYIADPSNPE